MERNASWGVRDATVVTQLAVAAGFTLIDTVDMPANNKMLFFKLKAF